MLFLKSLPTKTSFGPDGKKQLSFFTNDLKKLFHGREKEDGGTGLAAGKVAKRAVDERLHAFGEVILLEERGAFDLVFEKGIETQNRGATV